MFTIMQPQVNAVNESNDNKLEALEHLRDYLIANYEHKIELLENLQFNIIEFLDIWLWDIYKSSLVLETKCININTVCVIVNTLATCNANTKHCVLESKLPAHIIEVVQHLEIGQHVQESGLRALRTILNAQNVMMYTVATEPDFSAVSLLGMDVFYDKLFVDFLLSKLRIDCNFENIRLEEYALSILSLLVTNESVAEKVQSRCSRHFISEIIAKYLSSRKYIKHLHYALKLLTLLCVRISSRDDILLVSLLQTIIASSMCATTQSLAGFCFALIISHQRSLTLDNTTSVFVRQKLVPGLVHIGLNSEICVMWRSLAFHAICYLLQTKMVPLAAEDVIYCHCLLAKLNKLFLTMLKSESVQSPDAVLISRIFYLSALLGAKDEQCRSVLTARIPAMSSVLVSVVTSFIDSSASALIPSSPSDFFIFAMVNLLHMYSRSPKQILTVFCEKKIALFLIKTMRSKETTIETIHSTVACVANLLVCFSPCREVLISSGVKDDLVSFTSASHWRLRRDSLVALCNLAYGSDWKHRADILRALPVARLFELAQDDSAVVLSGLELLRNLVAGDSELVLGEASSSVLSLLGYLLEAAFPTSVKQAVLCVLANLAAGPRDIIIHNDDLLTKIRDYLAHSDISVQIAAVKVVTNLATPSSNVDLNQVREVLQRSGVSLQLNTLSGHHDAVLAERVRLATQALRTSTEKLP